ncbi:MAG: hypothetical protein R2827_07960 [Bdellovibrionales bacterium]
MKLLIILSILGLTACSSLRRSDSSGYGYSNELNVQKTNPRNYFKAKHQKKVDLAKAELGYEGKSAVSESDQSKIRLRMILGNLESQLTTRSEKQEYYKLKPFFANDVDRIRFLSLKSPSQKKAFLQMKNVTSDDENYDDNTVAAIESNDIILGMTKSAVKESWGDPDFIEVAGDSLYGNERWTYSKYVSSESGYNKENRIIVFESGLVAGWDRTNH